MNGLFIPQISPNVGHYQPAADFHLQNGLNNGQQMDNNNSVLNQYYPTNINFGVQNVFCNNFLQHATPAVAQQPSQQQNMFFQHYPTSLIDQTASGEKILDARPESLWESGDLKLPSLSHAHAAELRSGFSRPQKHANNKVKLRCPTYSNDEAEAVSALASLGHGSGNDHYGRFYDASKVKSEITHHQQQTLCQNLPQVQKINQSDSYEINFRNYGGNYKNSNLHQTNAEWYMNGVKFEALKAKSDCNQQRANLSSDDVIVRNHTQFNDNQTYNGYDTAQFYAKNNFVTPEYSQSQQQQYTAPDFVYAFGPQRTNQFNNFVNHSPSLQHFPLKLDTNVAVVPSTAGPLSQESPAYKSFCENSLSVDGHSSWRPAFVQKSPVLKVSPRNRAAFPNGISLVSPFSAALSHQQTNEMVHQQQHQRLGENLSHINGFAVNNLMLQSKVHLTPNHFSPNGSSIEFRHLQEEIGVKNASQNSQAASSSEFVHSKKIPQCQLGDILAMKKKPKAEEEIIKNVNNSYFNLPNESFRPKIEPCINEKPTLCDNSTNETDKEFSLAGAKDFVNEFIRQMDTNKVQAKTKQKKESVPEIEIVTLEVVVEPKKKSTTKINKTKKNSLNGLKSISNVLPAKHKSEKIDESAIVSKTFVSMPKFDEKDPLTLSLANFSTLLAINAKSASLKRQEKTFISTLPLMFGSPIKIGGKIEKASSKLLPDLTSPPKAILSSSTCASNSENSISIANRKSYDIPENERVPLWNGTHETEENLIERLSENLNQPMCVCNCLEGKEINEELEGPYYTHLAAAPTVSRMRTIMEERFGHSGNAVRIEKVRYTGKEGKTSDGCPIAKWVIRRSGLEEKVLCVVRQRQGHSCATAVLCVIIVVWEGVPKDQADDLYDCLRTTLPLSGIPTNRRCETNEKRNCACQGVDETTAGASFSFGCSWSMYYNACKFAKSPTPKKFKLADVNSESVLENKFHLLADSVGPVYKQMAPASYRNQTFYSHKAQGCRLGRVPGNPFSGITACVDFCAHAHKDSHNMNNGCTVVVTLTKHRGLNKPDDEQLHVLPMYVMDETDENGRGEGQTNQTNLGLEVLTKYPINLRLRTTKLPSCKQRTKMQTGRPLSQKKSKRIETTSPIRNTHSSFSLPDNSQMTPTPITNVNSDLDPSMTRSCESTAPKTVPPKFEHFNGVPTYPAAITNQIPFGGQRQVYSDFINPNYNQNGFNSFDGCYYPASNTAMPTNNVVSYGNYGANYALPWNPSSSFNCQFNGSRVISQNVDPWNNGSSSQWPTVAQEVIVGASSLSETPTNSSTFTYGQSSIDLNVSGASLKRKLSFDSSPVKEVMSKDYFYKYTENESAFNDNTVGGVAIALGHGSVLFEVAKKELHATTALRVPDRRDPKRISLVFYQHKHMNYEDHGAEVYRKRLAEKAKAKENIINGVVDDGIDDLNETTSSSLNSSFSPDLPDVEQLPTWDDWAVPSKRWSTSTRNLAITVNAKSTFQCRVSGQYSLKS